MVLRGIELVGVVEIGGLVEVNADCDPVGPDPGLSELDDRSGDGVDVHALESPGGLS